MRTDLVITPVRLSTYVFAGLIAFFAGSIAIAQNQMAGSANTGLSGQSAIFSPHSVTPPFVRPSSPQYGAGQNASPFMNSPATAQTTPLYGTTQPAPDIGPSLTAPLSGPLDSDIVSGTTMSSQAGSNISTQSKPASTTRAPASVPAAP